MSPERDAAAIGLTVRDIARTHPEPSRALVEDGVVDAIEELAAMRGVQQDPIWHPEGDVLTHCLIAADLAASDSARDGIAGERRELLVLAALLHDVGKPQTTTRNADGRIISHGHADAGAAIVRGLGERLVWPEPLTGALVALVDAHMATASVKGTPTRRAVRRLSGRLEAAGTGLDDWARVVRADGSARGSAAHGDAAEPWLRVAAELDQR
ncbi:HDIG domain-containing metalloprotein [Microbacterium sp.]|uniref:HDIG domain-containing metalloprotein n=1 Tax=Microbacterium sp. TaxID=51671 RepID=UPI002811F43B|nr:HDIG domain-containing metalloprotein [Microbacterium sp.]